MKRFKRKCSFYLLLITLWMSILNLPVPVCNGDIKNKYHTALFDMTLEELMNLEVKVASLFPETSLEASSTVEIITPKDWQYLGARKIKGAFANLPNVIAAAPVWLLKLG